MADYLQILKNLYKNITYGIANKDNKLICTISNNYMTRRPFIYYLLASFGLYGLGCNSSQSKPKIKKEEGLPKEDLSNAELKSIISGLNFPVYDKTKAIGEPASLDIEEIVINGIIEYFKMLSNATHISGTAYNDLSQSKTRTLTLNIVANNVPESNDQSALKFMSINNGDDLYTELVSFTFYTMPMVKSSQEGKIDLKKGDVKKGFSLTATDKLSKSDIARSDVPNKFTYISYEANNWGKKLGEEIIEDLEKLLQIRATKKG